MWHRPILLPKHKIIAHTSFVRRAGWQSRAADPTLPLGAAVAFSVWRFFDKRRKRNPEGPFWGGSPVWGALASTLLGLLFGFVVRAAPLATLAGEGLQQCAPVSNP